MNGGASDWRRKNYYLDVSLKFHKKYIKIFVKSIKYGKKHVAQKDGERERRRRTSNITENAHWHIALNVFFLRTHTASR